MRLWINNPETQEGKYLVVRRDGTVPDWPHFVLGARDPAAPMALRAYTKELDRLGEDPEYISDLYALAQRFEEYRREHGDGDPTAPRHRTDDPVTLRKMRGEPEPEVSLQLLNDVGINPFAVKLLVESVKNNRTPNAHVAFRMWGIRIEIGEPIPPQPKPAS